MPTAPPVPRVCSNLWYCASTTVRHLLEQAGDYAVDGLIIEFAHSPELPCRDWSTILDDLALYEGVEGLEKTGEDRGRTLALRHGLSQVIDAASRRGMRVYIMGTELAFSPEALARRPALGDPGQTVLYEVTACRLAEIYDALPQLAGVKIYLDEGPLNLNELDSPVPRCERLRRLLTGLLDVSRAAGRTLMVSTFSLMPHQARAIVAALEKIPPDPHLLVDNYICPGDWGRVRLVNPWIGHVGGHQEMLSFDYCGQALGMSVLPLDQSEFLRQSLQLARARSDRLVALAGYVSWDLSPDLRPVALGTPSEVTVYAACRLAHGEAPPAGALTPAWAEERYGARAGPHVAAALAHSRDVALRSWLDLGFWVHEVPESEPADLAWYDWSLHWESLAIWDESLRETETMLLHPTERAVATVVAEKEAAVQLASRALGRLSAAQPFLSPTSYGALVRYFERAVLQARALRVYSEAFYRAKMWHCGDRAQRTPVVELIDQLDALSREVEMRGDSGFWTCRPERLQLCAAQLREVLAGAGWPDVGGRGRLPWLYNWFPAAREPRWQDAPILEVWREQLRRWGYAVLHQPEHG